MNKYCLQKWRMALDSLIMSRLGEGLSEGILSIVRGFSQLVFLIKYQEYELIVQNSLVYSCLTYLKMGQIGAHCFWGSWGRAAGSKCCAFKGGKKKFSRAAESAQFCCSRHSELSGEPHGGRRGGREQRHFPGNHFYIYGFLKRNIAICAR